MALFIALITIGLVLAGLGWCAWRAWGLAFLDARQAARYRPQAHQIANKQAADTYAAHHPQRHSVRFVRRGTFDDE